MGGNWEQIGAQYFDITEDMTMEFQGQSYNILSSAGSLVENLDVEHGRVTREVLAGYQYYGVWAWSSLKRSHCEART